MNNPFELLYVSVLDNDRRVYTTEGPARARITSAVNQKFERFAKNCELWTVGAQGWQLIFSAKAGDHYSKITWKTVIESNKRQKLQREAEAAKNEENKAREQYDQLRERFEK